MTDWRELTGRDLEIEIAKRRGWRVEKKDSLVKGIVWYSLWRPDNTEVDLPYTDGWEKSYAWEYAPRYLTDANAIRELMAEIFQLDTDINHNRILLLLFLDGNFTAICKLWLELQESKDADA